MPTQTNTSNTVPPIPEGYSTVTPWIIVKGAAALIDYLKAAFQAEELSRVPNEDGTLGHAEVRIGDSIIMLFDAKPSWPDTPAFFRLYVEDGDTVYRRAIEAGGTSVTEPTELAFGDKVGRVRDPFGNIWWIQQRLEVLDNEEMGKRMQDPRYAASMQYVQNSLDESIQRS